MNVAALRGASAEGSSTVEQQWPANGVCSIGVAADNVVPSTRYGWCRTRFDGDGPLVVSDVSINVVAVAAPENGMAASATGVVAVSWPDLEVTAISVGRTAFASLEVEASSLLRSGSVRPVQAEPVDGRPFCGEVRRVWPADVDRNVRRADADLSRRNRDCVDSARLIRPIKAGVEISSGTDQNLAWVPRVPASWVIGVATFENQITANEGGCARAPRIASVYRCRTAVSRTRGSGVCSAAPEYERPAVDRVPAARVEAVATGNRCLRSLIVAVARAATEPQVSAETACRITASRPQI